MGEHLDTLKGFKSTYIDIIGVAFEESTLISDYFSND